MGESTFFDKLTENNSKKIHTSDEHKSPSVVSVDKTQDKQTEKSKKWLTEPSGQLALDVYQTERDIIIKSTIAGAKSADIDISLTNDMLSIKGSRAKDTMVKPEDYYYQECYWGSFARSVILPVEVDPDRVQAHLKNGILTITLPKSEKIKTKKISVDDN